MCTVILAVGSSAEWPILLAANRDEKLDRPAKPPGCHWPDQPDVAGGLDVLAGGTWLAVNRAGVVAAALNRVGSLGPAPGKRSRGELPLLALRHARAAAAVASFDDLNAGRWRSFNLVVADREGAFFVRGTGQGRFQVQRLAPGVHMVTAHDPDDFASSRVARHLPFFRATPVPVPPDWGRWPALLADSGGPVEAALCIKPFSGFGTVSSALVGIGGYGQTVFRSAKVAPDSSEFSDVLLP